MDKMINRITIEKIANLIIKILLFKIIFPSNKKTKTKNKTKKIKK